MTPTAREDTRPGRAVAVGVDRPGAAQVFGGAFDRMLITTYDDVAAELAAEQAALDEAAAVGDPVTFVGVAAGPGMEAAVDVAFALMDDAAAAGQEPPQVAVEVPWDLDALDHLRRRLTEPGAPALADVRRYRDRPCLVLGGPAAPVDDPSWWLGALLTAGTTAPDARVAHQDRVAAEWERASAAAQLERKEAELRDVREELKAARATLRRRGGAGRPDGRHGGPAGRPTVPPATGGRAGQARRAAAVVARRAGGGRGPRVGSVVLLVTALAGLLAPAAVLGLVAEGTGVVVGLALGATLLAVGCVAVVLVVAHRTTAASLARLEQSLARQRRGEGPRGRRSPASGDDADLSRRLEAYLDRTDQRLDALSEAVSSTAAREGLLTRQQVQALLNLAAMVPLRAGLPPLGGWATCPDLAVEVLDRLVVERPALVVEAGSGPSTLLLALAAREHGVDTRIVSLEHDARLATRTRELLERHGVADRAEVRFAPLARTHLSDHLTPWYDEASLTDLDDVGLLVVHGPPAPTGPAARYPAVPLLRDALAPRCSIVVDGTDRADDGDVMDRWTAMLPDFERRDLPLEKGAVVLTRR